MRSYQVAAEETGRVSSGKEDGQDWGELQGWPFQVVSEKYLIKYLLWIDFVSRFMDSVKARPRLKAQYGKPPGWFQFLHDS